MKLSVIVAATLLVTVMFCQFAIAVTDGNYTSIPVAATWDGTYGNLLAPTTPDYIYTIGDEEFLTYDLPLSWQFKFYGRPYSQITVDTNGNIWFGTPQSANSFQLPNAGLGRVAVAWNDDLSSLYSGGVFVQHLTAPERVVIEWQTETFTDEGTSLGNNFEVVLFDNGSIRFDYKPVNAATLSDFGSGISKDDATHYVSVTDNYGSPTTYASAQSILLTPIQYNVQVVINGSGTVTSNPSAIASNTTLTVPYQAGADFILTAAPAQYSLFNGWSNGICTGTGLCQFVLNTDTTATATFVRDTAHQANINGTYYSTIQAAYNAAADAATIKLWATDYTESVTCGSSKTIEFAGGYDSGYASQVGTSVIHGVLNISQGKVTVNGIAIQP